MFSSPQTNMEVLNASGIAPVSTLHPTDRRPEAKRLSLPKLPKFPPAKNLEFRELVSRSIGGGLSVLSSVLSGVGLANALTYEEALQQSVSSGDSPNFDFNGLLDGVVGFATENPLVIGGGAVALVVPLVLSNILGKPKAYGVESSKSAYARLAEDPDVQLLDIREGKEFKESGSPDVRGLKKKAVSIAYRGDDKNGFLKKLALKFKDPANTTLVILDRFDGNSELVAELVTVNGFKAAYAIKDGAEGTRGWKNSGLPWSAPKKSLAVDFGGLQDAFSGVLGEGSDGLPVTLGLAAATGLGVLVLSEIETVLQLLGSAAVIQFATKKLLFAEDRKATLRQVDEFLNTKVAPKELADEIKMIGKALLPISTTVRPTLPAPVEEAATTMAAETHMEPKVEEVAEEPPQEVNSVPKAEIALETKPAQARPLSPYPYYPDLKPPSSPAPSQP